MPFPPEEESADKQKGGDLIRVSGEARGEANPALPVTTSQIAIEKIESAAETPNFAGTNELRTERPTIDTYGALEHAFDYFNADLFEIFFGVRLRHVIFVLPKSDRFAGYFAHNTWDKEQEKEVRASEIALNPLLFRNQVEVYQTIVHEMVHHAQAELSDIFGKASERGYHNKKFAKVMEILGLMPVNVDKPGCKTGYRITDTIIPGGAFERVCRRYLELGATLSWAARGAHQNTADAGSGNPTSNNAATTEGKRKQDSKTTFRCPTSACNQRVYGKRSTRVHCEDHMIRLVPVEKNTNAQSASPTK